MEEPVVPLEAKSVRSLLQEDYYGKGNSRKSCLGNGWEKVPNWECLFVNSVKELFLSVHVDGVKKAGKRQNLDPMWKILMKDVDLGEPSSFPDHVYLGCTQRERTISNEIVIKNRNMFESGMSAGGIENSPFLRKSEGNDIFMVL